MTKYVELETAIDAVNDVYYDSPDINLSADKLEDALRGVPYADVVPVVHGQWDESGYCTNCGRHAPFWAMSSCYYKSHYCPNCGAKMDLEALQ